MDFNSLTSIAIHSIRLDEPRGKSQLSFLEKYGIFAFSNKSSLQQAEILSCIYDLNMARIFSKQGSDPVYYLNVVRRSSFDFSKLIDKIQKTYDSKDKHLPINQGYFDKYPVTFR
jgi:hypothetical protein